MNRHELKEKCRAAFGRGKGTSWIEIAPNEVLEKALAENKAPTTSYTWATAAAGAAAVEALAQPVSAAEIATNTTVLPEKSIIEAALVHNVAAEEQSRASAEELIKKAQNMLSALKTRPAHQAPVATDPVKETKSRTFQGVEFPITKHKRSDLVPAKDPGYCWDKNRAQKVALALANEQRIFLVGPRGCGKSTLVEQVCAQVGRPCLRVNMHGDVTASSFVGEKTIDNQGKIVFAYGVLPQAMKEGVVLILDELPSSPPDITLVLQRVSEGGPLVLMENGGEIIEPAKWFQIFATGNDILGDQQGIYTACKVMDASSLDRYHGVIQFTYMTKASEKKVLLKKYPDIAQYGDLVDRVVELARQVREARKNNDVTFDFSMRRLLSFCEFLVTRRRFIADDKKLIASAAEDAIIGMAGEGDRPKLTDMVQRHFDVQTSVEQVQVENEEEVTV
jgi:cobaltochelatase CobS